MAAQPRSLPGGRFAAERRGDFARLAAGVGWLLGPRAWWLTHRGDSRRAERRWAAAALRWLDARCDVRGLEHVDPRRSYVIAPLHEGFADALMLLSHLPLDVRFVARTELGTWPLLGTALRRGGHPMIRPESGAMSYRRLRRSAPSILDTGESLVMFPQGTILGIETAFSPGTFQLAATLRRPVLPVVLTGTHRLWEHPFSPVVRFGQPVHMEVLPPVEPGDAVAMQHRLERSMKRRALLAPCAPRRFEPERDGWWDGYAYTIDPRFEDLAARVAAHRAEVAAA